VDLIALIKDRARNHSCLSCSKALAGCEVSLLSQESSHCTVSLTCASCGASFVAVILLRRRLHPEGVPAGIETPIDGDELVDLHQRLAAHRGRLTDLLTAPRQG
jgi:hypothetical protein